MTDMNCTKCGAEMFEAIMTSNTVFPVMLMSKKAYKWDVQKSSALTCHVCPQCGFVELYAADPQAIKPKQTSNLS